MPPRSERGCGACLAATVAPWSVRSAAVAAAISIGDRTGLAASDEERLQAAGTYHVIAISGGNIAILTVLLLVVGRWLAVPPRVVALAAIAVLLAYGQVTGSAASIDRAIAAAILFLSGRLLEHRVPPINVLAVAAMLGLTVAPTTILDPGFILSFGATLGILIGVPRLTALAPVRPLSRRSPAAIVADLTTVAGSLLRATIAAEIALMPIAAAMFGRVTVAGLLLNFVAIPLMTVVQVGSLAGLGIWLWDRELARWCGYIVHLSGRGLIDSARLVDVVAVAVAGNRAASVELRRCLLPGARRGFAAAALCRGSQRRWRPSSRLRLLQGRMPWRVMPSRSPCPPRCALCSSTSARAMRRS